MGDHIGGHAGGEDHRVHAGVRVLSDVLASQTERSSEQSRHRVGVDTAEGIEARVARHPVEGDVLVHETGKVAVEFDGGVVELLTDGVEADCVVDIVEYPQLHRFWLAAEPADSAIGYQLFASGEVNELLGRHEDEGQVERQLLVFPGCCVVGDQGAGDADLGVVPTCVHRTGGRVGVRVGGGDDGVEFGDDGDGRAFFA